MLVLELERLVKYSVGNAVSLTSFPLFKMGPVEAQAIIK